MPTLPWTTVATTTSTPWKNVQTRRYEHTTTQGGHVQIQVACATARCLHNFACTKQPVIFASTSTEDLQQDSADEEVCNAAPRIRNLEAQVLQLRMQLEKLEASKLVQNMNEANLQNVFLA